MLILATKERAVSETAKVDDGGAPDETVAVIVVSGVGDDTLGSGRDAIVATLTSDPAGRWAADASTREEQLVACADTGDVVTPDGPLRTGLGSPNLREAFPVPAARVAGRDDAPTVDVYEMHWADLSRAQGPIQRLFYLLFAITLQLSTMGRDAVGRYAVNRPDAPQRRLNLLAGSLTVMSYWLAYVITPLVLAQVALAVVVNLELLTRPGSVSQWVILGGVAAAFTIAGWWVGGRIYRGGWTFDRPGQPWGYKTEPDGRRSANRTLWTTVVLAVALIVLVFLAFSGSVEEHVDSELLVGIGYLVFVALTALAIGGQRASRANAAAGDPAMERRTVRYVIQGACATVPLGALLLAAFRPNANAHLATRSADALTSIAMGPFRLAWLVMLLLCAAVTAVACWLRFGRGPRSDERRALSATVMMSVVLGPVLYAIATSAMFLVFAALARVYPSGAERWPTGVDAPNDPGTVQCAGSTILRPATTRCDGVDPTATLDWGLNLVRATVQPLGMAMILLAVLITVIGVFFAGYVATFRARGRHASSTHDALLQGGALTQGLSRSGRDWIFGGLLTVLVAAPTVGSILFWFDGGRHFTAAGEAMSGVAFPVAYLLAVLAVAGIGLKNVGFVGRFGGGFLRIVALVTDVIYDIATYLRVATPAIVSPRIQMIARYRALLAHLRDTGHTRIVIMAHSQGSALTLATLLGDQDRTPPLQPAPTSLRPDRLTVLTYGCPATQTYARRFPSQVTNWTDPQRTIPNWLNVYRAGDYVGRSITEPPGFDPTFSTRDSHPQERCLGPGQHMSYFSDERWRRVARYVVATPFPASLAAVDLTDLTVEYLDRDPAVAQAPADGAATD